MDRFARGCLNDVPFEVDLDLMRLFHSRVEPLLKVIFGFECSVQIVRDVHRDKGTYVHSSFQVTGEIRLPVSTLNFPNQCAPSENTDVVMDAQDSPPYQLILDGRNRFLVKPEFQTCPYFNRDEKTEIELTSLVDSPITENIAAILGIFLVDESEYSTDEVDIEEDFVKLTTQDLKTLLEVVKKLELAQLQGVVGYWFVKGNHIREETIYDIASFALQIECEELLRICQIMLLSYSSHRNSVELEINTNFSLTSSMDPVNKLPLLLKFCQNYGFTTQAKEIDSHLKKQFTFPGFEELSLEDGSQI